MTCGKGLRGCWTGIARRTIVNQEPPRRVFRKNVMGKKRVLIDLRDMKKMTCGFGQIAKNYAERFAETKIDGVQFVYLVPKNFKGQFGDVECVKVRPKLNKYFPFTLPKVDLWHSITQQQKLRRIGGSTKFLLTIHDLNFLTEKGKLRQIKNTFFLQRKVDKADVIVTISHYVAEQVKSHLNLKGKDVRVIHNGVERIDQNADRKPPFATGRPFFFTIGQIRKKKNFHLLLDVMKEFPETDLYICGDDHFKWAKTIRERISEEGLTNVFLTGVISQEEKVWLYRNCEAFLFPSQGEGFGLPVIEAMQFGKAVFASNYTCLPEICSDKAFVWKDLRTETMVKSIRENLPGFYDNKQRVEDVRQYAYSFSYEKHINAYLQIYRELLEK